MQDLCAAARYPSTSMMLEETPDPDTPRSRASEGTEMLIKVQRSGVNQLKHNVSNVKHKTAASMAMTPRQVLVSLMKSPDSKFDIIRVSKLSSAQLKRREHKQNIGHVDTLAKHTVPLEELEAAQARIKSLGAARQEAVDKLNTVRIDGLADQEKTLEELKAAIVACRDIGVGHKKYSADPKGGEKQAGAAFIKSAQVWADLVANANTKVTKAFEAALADKANIAKLNLIQLQSFLKEAPNLSPPVDPGLTDRATTKITQVTEKRRAAVKELNEAWKKEKSKAAVLEPTPQRAWIQLTRPAFPSGSGRAGSSATEGRRRRGKGVRREPPVPRAR